jgi:hypothetical protein
MTRCCYRSVTSSAIAYSVASTGSALLHQLPDGVKPNASASQARQSSQLAERNQVSTPVEIPAGVVDLVLLLILLVPPGAFRRRACDAFWNSPTDFVILSTLAFSIVTRSSWRQQCRECWLFFWLVFKTLCENCCADEWIGLTNTVAATYALVLSNYSAALSM